MNSGEGAEQRDHGPAAAGRAEGGSAHERRDRIPLVVGVTGHRDLLESEQALIKQRVREGEYYRQMKMGSLVSFKVLEIRENTVLVDFNEPMAGISARVDGEVVEVRQVSEAEIAEARENHRRGKIGCG